jgi:hypothetical protein
MFMIYSHKNVYIPKKSANYLSTDSNEKARDNVVVKALYYKPEGGGFEIRCDCFLIHLILSAALGPGVHSASNRYEYEK